MSVPVQMMLNHAIGLGRSRRSSDPEPKKTYAQLEAEKLRREEEHRRLTANTDWRSHPVCAAGEISQGFD